MEWRKRGYITVEELERLGLLPPKWRLEKGPVAIAECPEPIPCNICVDACPYKAISMDGINGLPRIDWSRCTGCGVCVSLCPGLAIFVVDLSKPDRALVTLPYEMLPEPKPGMKVALLSRDGRVVGEGTIVRVWERNRTFVVTVEALPELALEVRAIWVKEENTR